MKERQNQRLVIVSQCVDEWSRRVQHEVEVLYLPLHDPNRFGSTTAEQRVSHTAFNPSLNPPPRTTFCRGPKRAGMFFLNDVQRKAAQFCLVFGFEMSFDHYFGTGLDLPWMLISNELDSPLLLRSPALI